MKIRQGDTARMPADFARVAPRSGGARVAGAYRELDSIHGLGAGRTGAGRPGLPLLQEVF